MWYDSKHIKVFDPKEGYNFIANEYKNYHNHLNSFEKWFFLTLLPRDTKNLDVIDIGAWDGRIYKVLQQKKYQFNTYTACDIAEKLLKNHPKVSNKIICDLENSLPFEDNSFDLAFSFFVIEHIDNIDQLFAEMERILKPKWKRIIGHFLQRREFIRNKWADQFKIELINHRIQDLEKTAQKNLLKTHIIPITEKGALLGHLLVCEK